MNAAQLAVKRLLIELVGKCSKLTEEEKIEHLEATEMYGGNYATKH